MLQTSERYYRTAARLAQRAVIMARRAATPEAAALVVMQYQATEANEAAIAATAMLAEQGLRDRPEAKIVPLAFTTGAAEVKGMLSQIETDWQFDRLVSSLVQDAGRAAQLTDVTTRPHVRHVRHLNLPSCSRCAVLAGRVYRYSEGFRRHPGCFPEGTVVSGPAAHGATRRWYEGELVVIHTASGKKLTATGNHPVLTPQGWLPANLLAEGGDVLSRTAGDRSGALLVPDEDQMPARIEDVWGSGRMSPLGSMPVAPQDFHGDGLGSREVDVVLADRFMRDGRQVESFEQLRKESLARGIELPVALNASRTRLEFSGGHLPLLGGGLGGGSLGAPILWRLPRGTQQASLAGVTNRYSSFDQSSSNDASAESRSLGDGVLAFAGSVGIDQGRGVDRLPFASRWDAPAAALSHENRGTYASRGLDLGNRLASDVQADRIVKVSRVSWSGHVFNLTSSEGWYDADGIIVSNCDCVMIPTTVASPDLTYDPVELVRTGQVTGLSKADKKALEDDADFGQVVNVRNSKAGLKESGEVLTRAGRPTPAGIYRTAGDDRDRAISLLSQYGYIR